MVVDVYSHVFEYVFYHRKLIIIFIKPMAISYNKFSILCNSVSFKLPELQGRGNTDTHSISIDANDVDLHLTPKMHNHKGFDF